MEKHKNNKIKKFLFGLITICIAIFAFLFLSECLLRVYGIFYPNLFVSSDLSYNRFRGVPYASVNGFRLNSRGFNDLEFEKQKKEGHHRIVALGDSFAFGVVPYKNNFLTVMEESLNSKFDKFEVINMGIPSIGLQDYLCLLVYEGLDTNPDTILLCFFIGNDIYDHIKKDSERFHIITFYRFIKAYFKVQSGITKHKPSFLSSDENHYYDNLKTYSDSDYFKVEKSRSVVFSNNTMVIHHLQDIYKSLFLTFSRIKEICDSKKINLVVVLIPDEMQISKEIQNNLKSFNLLTEPIHPLISNEYLIDLDFERPNQVIRKELKAQNIVFLDLLEPIREKSRNVQLYKPNDSHWNIAGNKFAAELIKDFLVNQPELNISKINNHK